MRHVAVGVLNIGGTALAAVADGAAELVERVLVMQGVVGERLRVSAVARILDREMASRAPVDAVELGQEDLADLHRRALGQQPLVRRRRAADLLPDEPALVVLPRPVLVAVVAEAHENADQEAERGEPGVELADRGPVHISGPP